MSILGVRSIPLSQATRTAWSNAGLTMLPREDHDNDSMRSFIHARSPQAIFNMGNLKLNFDDLVMPIINTPETIRSISHPTALRRTLPDFIPPSEADGAHWHKHGGFGGVGTIFHEKFSEQCSQGQGDLQQHIPGDEYRIISVADLVVQASKKENLRWENGKHIFDWNWVGVNGIRTLGILPHVKQAVQAIPNWQHSILGWDIIDSGKSVFTIEVNTSPGVNGPTAERIVKAIRRHILDKETTQHE